MSDESAALTVITQLAGLVDYQDDSTVSRTVLKADGVRIVLFAFDAGQQLSEHTAAIPVLLQAVEGPLTVTAADQTVELTPGDVVHLGARVPHSVVANERSKMALTMLDNRR